MLACQEKTISGTQFVSKSNTKVLNNGGGRGRKKGDVRKKEAHKGAKERREERARKSFEMRCNGRTIREIASVLGVAPSTVHEDLEMIRGQLRAESLDLAEQEREISLQQVDAAISKLMPHITDGELIEIETVKMGKHGPVTITVEEYQARIKAAETLVKLIDRKSKLLGLDAPQKVEQNVRDATPPDQELARAKTLLSRWGFDFAVKGISGGEVG